MSMMIEMTVMIVMMATMIFGGGCKFDEETRMVMKRMVEMSVVVEKRSNSPVALAHLGPDVGTKPSQSSRDADHSAQDHKTKLSHSCFWSMSSHLKSWALNEDLLKYRRPDLLLRLEEDLSKNIFTFALKYVAVTDDLCLCIGLMKTYF